MNLEKKMNNKQKFTYIIVLSIFLIKIGLEIFYLNGDILWPSIGMIWCLHSMFVEMNNLKPKQ